MPSIDLETYWALESAMRKLLNIEVSCMMGRNALAKARDHVVATSNEDDLLNRFYHKVDGQEIICKAHNAASCAYCE